jgi:hypothetical protein
MANLTRKELLPLWLFIGSAVGLLISFGLCGVGLKIPSLEVLTSIGISLFFPLLGVLVISGCWGFIGFLIRTGRR